MHYTIYSKGIAENQKKQNIAGGKNRIDHFSEGEKIEFQWKIYTPVPTATGLYTVFAC